MTDTVSMVIRNIIRQLETPDRLRGRMTGVNMVFFIGGPQLGELEAGVVANWLGAPFSVVSGGVGCLIATAWIAADDAGAAPIREDERLLRSGREVQGNGSCVASCRRNRSASAPMRWINSRSLRMSPWAASSSSQSLFIRSSRERTSSESGVVATRQYRAISLRCHS